MPIQITTTLPDEDQPQLLNGVEDEVGVDRDDAVTNNGQIRLQIRETGQSSWDSSATGFDEQTIDYDTLETQFTGREDGEEYEVRARSETDYRTGAWTDPVSIISKFPGAVQLQATVIDETTVDLSWIDQADNEDGQEVIREQRVGEQWWPQEVLEDVGPNTENYTDDSVQPDTGYRYRVRPYTEHTSAESGTEMVITDELAGVRDRRVPARGWHVEVVHPSGNTLRPSILADDVEWRPMLKGNPRVRLPVRKSETWERADENTIEGQPIRCWKDGHRLPIEELRTVERSETQDILVAVGGTKLDDDVEGVEYPEEDAHVAAEDVIENDLGWVADVDDPATATRDDVSLASYSDAGNFTDAIQDAPYPDTDPREVALGDVLCRQTAWFIEGEDTDGAGTTFLADQEGNDGAWSGNRTKRLSSGQTAEASFNLDYTLPQGEGVIEFVWAVPETPTPELRVDVDGTEVALISEGALIASDDQFDLRRWEVPLNPDGDLAPGVHLIDLEHDGGGDLYWDFAHVRDDRYSYDTSDITPEDEVVTGWELYPESVDVVFEPLSTVEQVAGGRIDVGMVDDVGPQALALRNDTADTWSEATGTTSYATDFADSSQLLQARVTLGRYDTGSSSGQFGAAAHRLDLVELFADLTNTPVLIDFVHSGTYLDLLNRIADAGDSIWELRRAPESDAPYKIIWTQPGQRVADSEPALVEYSGRRTIEGSYQRAIVEGKAYQIESESFNTASDYGLVVGLQEDALQPGSETVYDVGDRDTQYDRGIDYTLDHSEGAIAVLEGGAMSLDTDYEIDYEAHYRGEYTEPGVSDPDTIREQIPDASSDRECEQLAIAIIREVAGPLEEAEVTIREPDPTRPLVEAIDPDELPFDGPLRVKSTRTESDQVTQTLGSRRSAGEVVDDLEDQLQAVARNV